MKLREFIEMELQYADAIQPFTPFPGGEGFGWGDGTGYMKGDDFEGPLKWVNLPVVRSDNVVLSDFNGVVDLVGGGKIKFRLHGYARPMAAGDAKIRTLRDCAWMLTFTADAPELAYLNNTFAVAEGTTVNVAERRIGIRGFECVTELEDLALLAQQ